MWIHDAKAFCNKEKSTNLRYTFYLELLVVAFLSLIPVNSVPDGIIFWDKAQHFIEFFVLTITGCLSYPRSIHRIMLGLLIYGASIELAQKYLTITRSGDILDLFADGLGIMIAGIVFSVIRNLLARRRSSLRLFTLNYHRHSES